MPTATREPVPTATAEPTLTATATAKPTPTATSEPTVAPTPRGPRVQALIPAADGGGLQLGVGNQASISIEIPPNALPEDTAISIRQLSRDELSEDIGLLGPVGAVYRLEPEGLEFAAPVTVTVRLPAAEPREFDPAEGVRSVVVLLRGAGGVWDILRDSVVEVDLASGSMTVTGQTEHFSETVVVDGPVQVKFEPGKASRPMGGTWPVNITVTNLSSESLVTVNSITFSAGGAVSLPETKPAPVGDLKIGASRSISPAPTFKCQSVGSGSYSGLTRWILPDGVPGLISVLATEGLSASAAFGDDTGMLFNVSGFATCTKPPPTAKTLLTGSTGSVQTAFPLRSDPTGDNGWLSDPAWKATARAWTDITGWAAWIVPGSHDAWLGFAGALPCGAFGFAGENSYVACTDDPLDLEDGPVLVATMVLAEPPPFGPDQPFFSVYTLVADGDGVPDNNFQFQPPFEYDVFQDTDQWYELTLDPSVDVPSVRAMLARDGTFTPLSSGTRVVINDRVITFIVPLSEFDDPAGLRVRLTAFSYDTQGQIDGTGSADTAPGDGPGFVDEALATPADEPDLFSDPPPEGLGGEFILAPLPSLTVPGGSGG